MPPHVSKPNFCQFGREKSDPEEQLCTFCEECTTVLEHAPKQELVRLALESLKPVACLLCRERFPDKPSCDQHYIVIHSKGIQSSQHLQPKELSVAELKDLRKRGLSNTGNKSILSRRLEGCVTGEMSL